MENLKNLQKLAKMLDGTTMATVDDFKLAINDVAILFAQYRSATTQINKETKDTLNLIVKQVNAEHDRILKEVKNSQQESESSLTEEVRNEVTKGIEKINAIVEELKSIEVRDGKDADEEKIVNEILEKIPKTEQETSESIVSKINNGKDLIDASKIKNLPQPTVNHITQGTFGQVETRLKAGTNITITTDSTGAKVINSTASGGSYSILTATGTIDDTNLDFTFASKPTEIVINHQSYIENDGWTWAVLTATLSNPVGSGGSIYGRS